MKLAFSTLPCENWPFEKTLELCREHAIDGIELRLGTDEWSDDSMTVGYANEMLKKLDDYHVRITNIGSSVLVRGFQEDKMQEYIKSLRLAKLLRAKGVRVFLGNFLTNFSDEKEDLDYNGIVRWIKEAADISSRDGIEIWIETHNEFATGRALKGLMKDVDKANCKIIWDIMHPIEQNETVAETIHEIWDYVAHFHIKDGKKPFDEDKANWDYTKLGEGTLPIAEIVEKAEKLGFDGYYSLEWESKWRDEINQPGCEGEVIIPQFARYMRAKGGINK